jgi:hypothetical protein
MNVAWEVVRRSHDADGALAQKGRAHETIMPVDEVA